jgi:hypothetical protein
MKKKLYTIYFTATKKIEKFIKDNKLDATVEKSPAFITWVYVSEKDEAAVKNYIEKENLTKGLGKEFIRVGENTMKKRTKLADLLSEHAFERSFGEPNPTLEDTINAHGKKNVNEAKTSGQYWLEELEEIEDELDKAFGNLEVILNENSSEDWFNKAYSQFDRGTNIIENGISILKKAAKLIKA